MKNLWIGFELAYNMHIVNLSDRLPLKIVLISDIELLESLAKCKKF